MVGEFKAKSVIGCGLSSKTSSLSGSTDNLFSYPISKSLYSLLDGITNLQLFSSTVRRTDGILTFSSSTMVNVQMFIINQKGKIIFYISL